VLAQGHADQCMVFSMSRSTGKVKLGNHWGDSHALTIKWVHIGDLLLLDMVTYSKRHYALPGGNVGK
jgi:hypothetical protein